MIDELSKASSQRSMMYRCETIRPNSCYVILAEHATLKGAAAGLRASVVRDQRDLDPKLASCR
jgi:hypothetical protein